MVAKKKSKKATSELESQMASAKEMLNEDFYEANQILKDNEGLFLLPLNSQNLSNYLCILYHFCFVSDSGNEFEDDKDDMLLEKLKSLDGKKMFEFNFHIISKKPKLKIFFFLERDFAPKLLVVNLTWI